jgi:hypothetical protein
VARPRGAMGLAESGPCHVWFKHSGRVLPPARPPVIRKRTTALQKVGGNGYEIIASRPTIRLASDNHEPIACAASSPSSQVQSMGHSA